jgi:hypothetical protein
VTRWSKLHARGSGEKENFNKHDDEGFKGRTSARGGVKASLTKEICLKIIEMEISARHALSHKHPLLVRLDRASCAPVLRLMLLFCPGKVILLWHEKRDKTGTGSLVFPCYRVDYSHERVAHDDDIYEASATSSLSMLLMSTLSTISNKQIYREEKSFQSNNRQLSFSEKKLFDGNESGEVVGTSQLH